MTENILIIREQGDIRPRVVPERNVPVAYNDLWLDILVTCGVKNRMSP